MKVGGIVLCGGKSSRMGRAKAWLPFGGEFLLQRVVRAVREATDEVAVVAGTGQEVPPLPSDVRVVRDAHESCGPLAGLYAGLLALADSCEVAYLSACDAPFLTAAFVRAVVGALREPSRAESDSDAPGGPTPPAPLPAGRGERRPSESDRERATRTAPPSFSPLPAGRGAGGVRPRDTREVTDARPEESDRGPRPAVPFTDRPHPLAAAYPIAVLPTVQAMLDANQLRMTDLLTHVSARLIPGDELRPADPDLRSLWNLNTPDECEAALRELAAS